MSGEFDVKYYIYWCYDVLFGFGLVVVEVFNLLEFVVNVDGFGMDDEF